ncbi:unnamed protein product [Lupinus luteus]|uniref:Uncharacterized protein n=1 Tax=Lupinus luteus TaxID=3873 RepID=A0AAV1X297_LUPLU
MMQTLPLVNSPEAVIKRFEQRDCAVDSTGIAEYLRALVVTNAIAEYLRYEESGNLLAFLRWYTLNCSYSCSIILKFSFQELKQRASGNSDETFLSPGISEKQPLHVVMKSHEEDVGNFTSVIKEFDSMIPLLRIYP